MNNIIVMYHYVRDNTDLKAFSTEEFRKQIDYLMKYYKMITIKELIQNKPKENTCILTFDDGIKDGITNALPILKESQIPATFFIPTVILENKKLLETQKRHLLLAKLGKEKFVEEFNGLAEDIFQIDREKRYLNYKKFDDTLTANLKYVLDFMDQEKSKKYIDIIFNKHFNEEEEFDKIHLNKNDILKLEQEGMEIGTHGHNHQWLGKLYHQHMENDIAESVAVFKRHFLKHPLIMSYPFGSYSLFTKRVAKKHGFIAGVTTLKNNNMDLNNPLELNRFDCINIYPRQSEFKIP